MITKKDLVSDIRRYVDRISQVYFKLEMKQISRGRLDPSLRHDLETNLTTLRNSIDLFRERFEEGASAELTEEINDIASNLNTETPEIVKPQE